MTLTRLLLITLSLATSTAFAAEWQIVERTAHHVELTSADNELDIRTTGRDPYFVGQFNGPVTAQDHILEFEYFCPAGIDDFSVIPGPPIGEATRINLPPLMIAEGWRTYSADLKELSRGSLVKNARQLRFDLGTHADIRIQIRNVRLRPPNQREQDQQAAAEKRRASKIARAKSIREYLTTEHPNQIKNIAVTDTHVVISTNLQPAGAARIIEYRPEHSIADSGTPVAALDIRQKNGRIEYLLERQDGDYDRVCSGWRIQNGKTLSARRYPDTIQPTAEDFAPKRLSPKNQKGLSCLSRRGPRSDFVELGISAVTINVAINQFLSPNDGPERERIPVDGDPVFFDPDRFKHYDESFEFARKHNMVASAIILIQRSRQTNTFRPLAHPEADAGVYVMPDLTSNRGATIYTYVLRRLAERYRNHAQAPGGITNWIVHNEIDFHTQWTNMGIQPRELVTETYYRSMRLIHNIAKQSNPHARVFASLTHHWNVPDDGYWKRLAPREVLEQLQRLSRIEGEFDWGVAYHPYPQSLFARVAWQDDKPTKTLNTPLITIQNLEVLGQFLRQDSMRDADGAMRPVLLSEQGFHTATYSQADLDDQAGSLWWTMKRVQSMPWIESFIYHRWIDHPAEGGLKLGLRTLPTTEHAAGERKRAWHVYQAIGTDKEAEITKGLPQPK